MAAICSLAWCPLNREMRCFACPNGGPQNPQYTPQPHTDDAALIRRAAALLARWVELYGEHNPQWLPPAGIVNWQEDASRYLALHALPALAMGAATGMGAGAPCEAAKPTVPSRPDGEEK